MQEDKICLKLIFFPNCGFRLFSDSLGLGESSNRNMYAKDLRLEINEPSSTSQPFKRQHSFI